MLLIAFDQLCHLMAYFVLMRHYDTTHLLTQYFNFLHGAGFC